MSIPLSIPSEKWRLAWRFGIAPSLSTAGLQALRRALETNDPTLARGATTVPVPKQSTLDRGVDAACAIGFAGWRGDGLGTVGDVFDFFACVCVECDLRMNTPTACRWFLTWFDDTPTEETYPLLLAEVVAELHRRNAVVAGQSRGCYVPCTGEPIGPPLHSQGKWMTHAVALSHAAAPVT